MTLIARLPNDPRGIQNAPIIPPMISKYFRPQNPFCIPALGSDEDLTPIISTLISVKNSVTIKHSLYTARYPTASVQSNFGIGDEREF